MAIRPEVRVVRESSGVRIATSPNPTPVQQTPGRGRGMKRVKMEKAASHTDVSI